jgi:hypothetical protein
MRLKSAIWAAAYVRRRHVEGAFAAMRRRGAEEAGAIFIVVNRLDGSGALYGPAPQSTIEEPAERTFTTLVDGPEAAIEARLARELKFDPDIWVIEVEDRAGGHCLDHVVT